MTSETVVGYELCRLEEAESNKKTSGTDVLRHLKKTGLIKRALSLESDLVKGWIADPATYPEELKEISTYLWGSLKEKSEIDLVAVLVWRKGWLYVCWLMFFMPLGPNDVALLEK